MPVAGAHAVAAGITAANHNHALAVGTQLRAEQVARIHLVLLGQKLHRKMHPVQVAARHCQIAGLFGAAGEQHRIKVLLQIHRRDCFAGPVGDLGAVWQGPHQHAGSEGHALLFHLRHTAVNMGFLHFEIGNAVAQQATDAVVFFKQGDRVAGTCELLCCGHASRARAHHRHFFSAGLQSRASLHPAFAPGSVDDGMLDRLDAYRLVVHIEGAGSLAGGRADAAGELGKVVGAVQNINGVFPVAPKHQLIEIGNDVVDRAAAVTKRCAAIHAPRGLLLGLPVIERENEFLVIFEPFSHGLVALLQPLKLHETSDFSHIFSLAVARRAQMMIGAGIPACAGMTGWMASPAATGNPQQCAGLLDIDDLFFGSMRASTGQSGRRFFGMNFA